MPATPSPTPIPTRRALVCAFGGALLLSGCGVRLEEDAPNIPLIPRREPVPGEPSLVGLESSSVTLGTLAPTLGGDIGTTLALMFVAQAQLARDILLHGGLPPDRLAPPASALPADLAPDAAPPARLAAAAVASVSPPALLSGADDAVRPSLVALAAQRYVAAALLTASPPNLFPNGNQWTGGQLPKSAADTYLALMHGGYLFEVVAAHSAADRRDTALAAATSLRSQAALILPLLPEQPSPPIGARLPERITDDASATRVAQSAVTAVVGAIVALLPAMTAGGQATAGLGMNRGTALLGPAVLLGTQWEIPLTAFPGLT